MFRALAVTGVSIALAGCALDPSKLVPAAAGQLQQALGQTTTLEQTLITELQAEDSYLNYVSRGAYSCGDPKDAAQRQLLSAKDPAQFIKQQKTTEAWQKSVAFIAAYVNALNQIVKDNTADLGGVASITTIGTAVASVPGFPSGTSAAVKAFQVAVDDIINFSNVERMKSAAFQMEAPLEAAVNNIKNYYPVFQGNEAVAFAKWDSCAQEKLRFIRDNPTQRMLPTYPAYFAISNGNDLEAAYVAYMTKRQQYRALPAITPILKSIVDQNKALYNPDLTLASAATAAGNAVSVFKDMQALATAVEALNPPKQKPKPKTAEAPAEVHIASAQ
jgi:hypothetical protein